MITEEQALAPAGVKAESGYKAARSCKGKSKVPQTIVEALLFRWIPEMPGSQVSKAS